jgi:DNA helicase-2/ATP-dependent DNA helicase PcrA
VSLPPDGLAEVQADPRLQGSLWRSAEEREAFLARAEVRDVLAWMRLLTDPRDAASVVRALARPPVELSQVELARVIGLARRQRLDMVAALQTAVESPQLPPQTRERVQRFLARHREASAALRVGRPDLFARVVLGDGVSLSAPGAGGEPEEGAEEGAGEGPARMLRATLQALREEVLADVGRIGARLGELRLDTDVDLSHGVVRYLELIKLAALLQRPPGEPLGAALADLNARLAGALTPLQREILQTSPLDGALLAAERDGERAAGPLPAHGEPSLGTFLPRNGREGLVLSASDIETYRGCPLRYKYARVLRVPSPSTPQQRFGIVVHQVLERYHAAGGRTLGELLELLDAAWRRAGLPAGEEGGELLGRARAALARYHERLREEPAEPVWFERPFSFPLGPHQLRGRVDRVDRLPGEGYELIDYKTSRPKSAAQLGEDVQLSLYALAAREDWRLEAPRQAYYYVLDDRKVPVPARADPAWLRDTVAQVADGILAQRFQPTPSRGACSLCDYRILCPAAET